MRIAVVSAWGLIPGLQLPSWGALNQAFNVHLAKEDCGTWLRLSLQLADHGFICGTLFGLLFLWIWLTPFLPNGQSSQLWTLPSWLSFCPSSNRAFSSKQPRIKPWLLFLIGIHLLGKVSKVQGEWGSAGKSVSQERVRLDRQISWHP